MSINIEPLAITHQHYLLAKFPEAVQDKLLLYTCEELFYVYKLMTFKPLPNKHGEYRSGDVFYLALKKKMNDYLAGRVKYGVHPNAWAKLGNKFKQSFEEFYSREVECYEAS